MSFIFTAVDDFLEERIFTPRDGSLEERIRSYKSVQEALKNAEASLQHVDNVL